MTLCQLFILLFLTLALAHPPKSFSFNDTNFLLNHQPFQILSGEMHYPRIPSSYWRHRIQMAKALGLNTISSYVFWNFHEQSDSNGQFDFTSESHDLRRFIEIIHEEGMYMILRPGPYVCGEWDGGGLPHWLLRYPLRFRCLDSIYLHKVEKYIQTIARLVKDLQITNGGPIIMVQIENEYGSYGNDHEYLKVLEHLWRQNGVEVPFYTADGAWAVQWKDTLLAGSVTNGVIGIDPGVSDESWEAAGAIAEARHVPIFSSETYPGWMTHWGEDWKGKSIENVLKELEFLLKKGKSFSFYMIHGGTNFGFSAGANYDEVNGFQPQITSYDYDAPINEQGAATLKYKEMRKMIEKYNPNNRSIFEIPQAIPILTFNETNVKVFASIWENLPEKFKDAQPKPMEFYNQYSGVIIYRNKLTAPVNGALKIKDVHDFGSVYLDDKLVDTVNRMKDPKKIVNINQGKSGSKLEILVMAMGRVNFGEEMLDHKGITEYVMLGGLKLMDWEVFSLDLNEKYIRRLNPLKDEKLRQKPGLFFQGSFYISEIGDTYIDLKKFKIGAVWVNGFNLGRFLSEIGPQTSLYCPGAYLMKGENKVIIFDLYQVDEASIKGISGLA